MPAREAVDALGAVRSIVDVTVYVREPESGAWRLLTFDEQRLLWSHRAGPDRPDDRGRESPATAPYRTPPARIGADRRGG